MNPSQIRSTTLKQMRAARTTMMSMRWTLELEGKDEVTKTQAAKELLRVHHAIQKLENEQLGTIRTKLLENETELSLGQDNLANALKDLKKTKNVLNAVSNFLSSVGRVVKLLA